MYKELVIEAADTLTPETWCKDKYEQKKHDIGPPKICNCLIGKAVKLGQERGILPSTDGIATGVYPLSSGLDKESGIQNTIGECLEINDTAYPNLDLMRRKVRELLK